MNWDKAKFWIERIKADYECYLEASGTPKEPDAFKAILNGTYDPESSYLTFKPKPGIAFDVPDILRVIDVELGSYNGPLPKILNCYNFKAGKFFNQKLPEVFWCVNFYCGGSFNQKFEKGFSCRKFSCDESYNQPLPKIFMCDEFLCGNKFNQPLPEDFICDRFYCQMEFNQPLPKDFKPKVFHCGWKFNQPLPPFFSCEKFDKGTSFNQDTSPWLTKPRKNKEVIVEHLKEVNPEKVYCIYHSVDNDGFGSGAIVKRKYPHAYLIPFMYTPEMDYLNKIPDGSSVFIVDASLPIVNMRALMERCDVHWIDHHDEPIMDALKDPIVSHCKGLRKMDAEAACELTWQYIYPTEPVPPAIYMLGRFDAWDQTYFPEALIFDMWVKSKNVRLNDTSMPVWIEIMSMTKTQIETAIATYRPVNEYDVKMNEISAKSICYEGTIGGYKAIVANRSQIGSPYFQSVVKPEHDVMVTWHMKPQGRYKYSVFANKASVDVGKLCKQFGGGGRKGVGGFLYANPFLPRTELGSITHLGHIDKTDPNITITKF